MRHPGEGLTHTSAPGVASPFPAGLGIPRICVPSGPVTVGMYVWAASMKLIAMTKCPAPMPNGVGLCLSPRKTQDGAKSLQA